MRIDSLSHITSNGRWFESDLNASISRLRSEMSSANIQKSVVTGLSTDDNNAILDAYRTFGESIIPVAFLDISLPVEELEFKIASIAEHGFAGIKIHPRISNVPLNSDSARHAVRLAGDHKLASFICTIHRPPLPPPTEPYSSTIQSLCEMTNSPIILVHGGYTELLIISEIIRPFEHVMLDLSMTYPRFRQSSIGIDIRWLTETFDQRIVLGSDFPEHTYGNILHLLEEDGYDIQALEKRGILGNNIQKVLNILKFPTFS